MKDEVKITVVATGFEGKGRMNPEPMAISKESTVSDDPFDKKPDMFIEHQEIETSQEEVAQPTPVSREIKIDEKEEKEEQESEELDIPAFIRKKMN